MPAIAIPAHFDGKQIVLDEPYDLPANANLLVTVLPANDEESINDEAWLKTAFSSDAFDFLNDHQEDIYSLADGVPITHTP